MPHTIRQCVFAQELRALAMEAKRYNTIISYHINTDEAYVNYTATECDGFNDCDYRCTLLSRWHSLAFSLGCCAVPIWHDGCCTVRAHIGVCTTRGR